MKVIIYGDFNCLYCHLASQRAGRPVCRPIAQRGTTGHGHVGRGSTGRRAVPALQDR